MITTAILLIIFIAVGEVLAFAFSFLPNVTVDSGVGSAIDGIVPFMANLNNILPIQTIFTVFLLILAVELGVLVYKIIMWGLRRLPTQS